MVMLLLIITLGFAFALLVLLQCELGEEQYPEYHSPAKMLFITVNMGTCTCTWVHAHAHGYMHMHILMHMHMHMHMHMLMHMIHMLLTSHLPPVLSSPPTSPLPPAWLRRWLRRPRLEPTSTCPSTTHRAVHLLRQ